jgi:hypothetical protein
MNVRSTVVWTVTFAVCDALAVFVHGAAGTWLPLVVLALAVVISRVSARLYLRSTVPAGGGPAAAVG